MGAPGGGEAFLVDRLTTRGFSNLSGNAPYGDHLVTNGAGQSDQDEKRSISSAWKAFGAKQLLSYLDSPGYVNETDLKQVTELRSQRNAVGHFTGCPFRVSAACGF